MASEYGSYPKILQLSWMKNGFILDKNRIEEKCDG